jgi:glyoxylase-like metal-dependent hydrolase (beta-lactamase superfamily II)
MNIQKIVVGQLDVNCYIISDDSNSEALIIDPGDEPEKIIEFIDTTGLQPKYILFTHAHYDHVCAAKELHDQYNAVIVMHEREITTYRMTAQLCISWGYAHEDFPEPERIVKDGDIISVGTVSFKVIHTPGHTPGSICILGENTLFSGDTLFKGSVGRTDLPEGDFGLLSQSLKKLMLLPPETRVLCGHESETSIEEEMRDNPFLKVIQVD